MTAPLRLEEFGVYVPKAGWPRTWALARFWFAAFVQAVTLLLILVGFAGCVVIVAAASGVPLK